jgi:hypothetical protein
MPLFHRGPSRTAVGPVLLSLFESIDPGNWAEFVTFIAKAPTRCEIVAFLPADQAEAAVTIATAFHQTGLPGRGVVGVEGFGDGSAAVYIKGEFSSDAFDQLVAAFWQGGRKFGLAVEVHSCFESDVYRDLAE